MTYIKHTARAATRGFRAVLALKRPRGLPPWVIRKLFAATLETMVHHASSVRTHPRGARMRNGLDCVQMIGGQAVIGCFRVVGTAVAEAEASIPTVKKWALRKAGKTCIHFHNFPNTHPPARQTGRWACGRFALPIQETVERAQCLPLARLETTRPYISTSWAARLRIASSVTDGVQAAFEAQQLAGSRYRHQHLRQEQDDWHLGRY